MRQVIFFAFVVLSFLSFGLWMSAMGWLFFPSDPVPATQSRDASIGNLLVGITSVIKAFPIVVAAWFLFLDLVTWGAMTIAACAGATELQKGFRYSLIYSMVLSFFTVIMAGWSVVIRILA
ncbi:hypothetical protein ACQ86N_39270 [Puia sp. P3]|uniref:hypothetical protein n=1 Tax=Puia sp. P3 TaxID=3423952 RepID=UPI003D670157